VDPCSPAKTGRPRIAEKDECSEAPGLFDPGVARVRLDHDHRPWGSRHLTFVTPPEVPEETKPDAPEPHHDGMTAHGERAGAKSDPPAGRGIRQREHERAHGEESEDEGARAGEVDPQVRRRARALEGKERDRGEELRDPGEARVHIAKVCRARDAQGSQGDSDRREHAGDAGQPKPEPTPSMVATSR
jgi:hypothetical protein